MIPAMYNDIQLSQSMLDEADQDTSLEVSSALYTGIFVYNICLLSINDSVSDLATGVS